MNTLNTLWTKVCTPRWAVLLIFTIGILFRLPLIGTEMLRTPDGLPSINVARNINAGKGLVQDVKTHYFDSHPVVTSAFHGKPIGPALIFAPLLKVTNDNVLSLQLFSLVISVLNGVVFYLLCSKYLTRQFALAGGLLVVMSPNMFIYSRIPLSEQIFSLCILLVLLIQASAKEGYKKYMVLGLLTGVSYYIRNEGLLLAFVCALLFFKNIKSASIYLLSFFSITLPLFVIHTLINGSPLYSYNYFHFQVKDFFTGVYNVGLTYPTPGEFIKDNFLWIIPKITIIVVDLSKSIIDIRSLGLFTLFLFLPMKGKKEAPLRFLIISASIFLTYAMLWSAIFEPPRHFPLVYMLLLLYALISIQRYSIVKIGTVLVVCTLIFYAAFDIHRILWAREQILSQDPWMKSDSHMYMWVREHTNKDSIIATTSPNNLNYFTSRPAAQFPLNVQDPKRYKAYTSHYDVCYFVIPENARQYLPLSYVTLVYFKESVLVYKDRQCNIK